MRSRGGTTWYVVVAFIAAFASGACKTHSEADAAADPKEQEELLKRRDALITARQKMLQDRADIQAKIERERAGSGSGVDVAALQKQVDDLTAKIVNAGEDSLKLLQEVPPANATAANAEVTKELEKLHAMEDRLQQREQELVAAAENYRKAAEDWKGTCSAGTMIIQQQPTTPLKGSFTKADVSNALARAHAVMSKKGLRSDDLAGAVGLEADASKAMDAGDFSRAMTDAGILVNTVDGLKIDRAFILQKFDRLKQYVNAHKETQQQAAAALQEITQKYGDSNYGGANQRINELWAQLSR
jgi:hypothetical protein